MGVSVEYLVTGKEKSQIEHTPLSAEARSIARYADQLSDTDRAFVLDFVKWIKGRN